jgi:hypothetical protein
MPSTTRINFLAALVLLCLLPTCVPPTRAMVMAKLLAANIQQHINDFQHAESNQQSAPGGQVGGTPSARAGGMSSGTAANPPEAFWDRALSSKVTDIEAMWGEIEAKLLQGGLGGVGATLQEALTKSSLHKVRIDCTHATRVATLRSVSRLCASTRHGGTMPVCQSANKQGGAAAGRSAAKLWAKHCNTELHAYTRGDE